MRVLRLRPQKDIKLPSDLCNFLQAERIRQDIKAEMSKEIQDTTPLIVSNYDHNDDADGINGETTYAMFSLNKALAHTKELGIRKHRYNYVTSFLMKGIKVIKSIKETK